VKPFFVYMLRCADGSYYLGHTDNLEHRVNQHQAGEIPGYTHDRRPVELVWSQETATREEALAAERRVKGWSRAKKEALMAGDWLAIQQHAWGTRNPMPAHLRAGSPSIPQGERTVSPSTTQGERTMSPSISQGERVVVSVRPEVSKDQSVQADAVTRGDRRALAKSITLLESTRADDRVRADALLSHLLPHTGKSLRIGISGVPGVGKSTFIEALGLYLIEQGHRVAVLAIDPSSSRSGGSILGDKTRMEQLSVNDKAFIRPSPTSGTLGGVAEHTREAMLVCEAAGHDVVIVETVGVGQSETAVAGMTDLFVLLQLPNAGDDLQAIKRGVMELADIVAINKADLDAAAATRAQAQITSALRVIALHGPHGPYGPQGPQGHAAHDAGTPVVQVSALKADGIAEFWATVQAQIARRRSTGAFDARRREQALTWMWDIIDARLKTDFNHHPAVRAALQATLDDVVHARAAPSAAARKLLDLFEKN
jgi:LAO/AO transport system kinase